MFNNLRINFIKNLESFGVQELGANEIKETEGGFLLFALSWLVAAPFAAAFVLGAYNGYHSAE